MAYSTIYDLLDYVLPSSDRSKNDILSLEYLSACKIMENDIIRLIPFIPSSMFETLLQTVIYKCYSEFINLDLISIKNIENFHNQFNERQIAFPDTLWILILNWPHTELVLRNNIPLLHPPVDIFQNNHYTMTKGDTFSCQVDDMLSVFYIFCRRLLQFITNAVFKRTSRNTLGCPCNLKRLDLSGLGRFCDLGDDNQCLSIYNILDGIHNSTIDTFGYKMEVFIDADLETSHSEAWQLLMNISEANLDLNFGLSVYFKYISLPLYNPDFYKFLALERCEYIQLFGVHIYKSLSKKISSHLPKLRGLSLEFSRSIESLGFLSAFASLEQFSLNFKINNGFLRSISNISKGLKYLDLIDCFLLSKDLECLAKSIHSETLLELNLSSNELVNDPNSVGLIKLCQKLNNLKVLIINKCSLEILSSHSISILVKAFQDCVKLEFLSMRGNVFSVDKTQIIINGLAHRQSLRYISLDLPKDRYDLCKAYHEKINQFRNLPIYISFAWSTN